MEEKQTLSIQSSLAEVQQNLKVHKAQNNSFGGYKYRSCEDIVEAVKPHIVGLTLTLSDSMEEIGGRVYVKATATLSNIEGEQVSISAYAREAEYKKGMDESQITGAASSYARKYALNGLFCIDDTEDADATHDGKDPEPQMITEKQKSTLMLLIDEKNLTGTPERVIDAIKWASEGQAAQLDQMTATQAQRLITKLSRIPVQEELSTTQQ